MLFLDTFISITANMAKAITNVSQYPRINDPNGKFNSFLDDSKLAPHHYKIDVEEFKKIVREGIEYASEKSKRHIEFELIDSDSSAQSKKYEKEGSELFKYFIKYCGDPAATAYDCLGKHYSEIAFEQFRNRILQMERMNSGWRNQYIAKDAARVSGRFHSVSDLNLQEADFVAVISELDSNQKLNVYVSVKNRSNTMGGQDWPKAISALEAVASSDKNRKGPYICVFGIAMEKGTRTIRKNGKTGIPYSVNTEIWCSSYFWPFFSNWTYEEVSIAVLEVLMEMNYKSSINVGIPHEVIDYFGSLCRKNHLVDESGRFNEPKILLKLFCGGK